MKLTTRRLKKMILKEMTEMMKSRSYGNLTFEKLSDIHRFLETASFNGRHWMFPQGVDHDMYATLNALFVEKIGREGSDDPAAMQEYVSMVMQIPGADLGSIEEILDA